MNEFLEEIDHKFNTFFEKNKTNVTSTIDELKKNKEVFNQSYRRLVSLQAWRSELFSKQLDEESQHFFREAHNDGLTSHSLAQQGAWRVSLMALRSCIENTLFGIYYCTHPVELQLWEAGEHKLGFTESINYLKRHPNFANHSESTTGIQGIKSEYSTLSKAVHASSKHFRMTKNGEISTLNAASQTDLNSWSCRERKTLQNLNLILTIHFQSYIKGAANINLRKAIGLSIPKTKHPSIRKLFQVSLR